MFRSTAAGGARCGRVLRAPGRLSRPISLLAGKFSRPVSQVIEEQAIPKRRAGNLAGRFRQSAGRIREDQGSDAVTRREASEHYRNIDRTSTRASCPGRSSVEPAPSPRSGRAFCLTGPSRDRPSFASRADRSAGDCRLHEARRDGTVQAASSGPQPCSYRMAGCHFSRSSKLEGAAVRLLKNPALPRAIMRRITLMVADLIEKFSRIRCIDLTKSNTCNKFRQLVNGSLMSR